jgi:hypothetical protein
MVIAPKKECHICKKFISIPNFSIHLKSKKHQKNYDNYIKTNEYKNSVIRNFQIYQDNKIKDNNFMIEQIDKPENIDTYYNRTIVLLTKLSFVYGTEGLINIFNEYIRKIKTFKTEILFYDNEFFKINPDDEDKSKNSYHNIKLEQKILKLFINKIQDDLNNILDILNEPTIKTYNNINNISNIENYIYKETQYTDDDIDTVITQL